jgi:hypothetical protein
MDYDTVAKHHVILKDNGVEVFYCSCHVPEILG